MLEFASAQASVIHCFAEQGALDLLEIPEAGMAFRIARGELMCMSARPEGATLLTALSARLESTDPHAVVLDRSDAWAVFTVSGSDREHAFARLCSTPLPPPLAFLQGEIGGVPAKAAILSDRIHVMVSSILGHHLRERILEGCGDLAPREKPAAVFAMESFREKA